MLLELIVNGKPPIEVAAPTVPPFSNIETVTERPTLVYVAFVTVGATVQPVKVGVQVPSSYQPSNWLVIPAAGVLAVKLMPLSAVLITTFPVDAVMLPAEEIRICSVKVAPDAVWKARSLPYPPPDCTPTAFTLITEIPVPPGYVPSIASPDAKLELRLGVLTNSDEPAVPWVPIVTRADDVPPPTQVKAVVPATLTPVAGAATLTPKADIVTARPAVRLATDT
jgi:hypothetical protein